MNLQELKTRSPSELLAFAEELEIENCNTMRKQDMMFAILKATGRSRCADCRWRGFGGFTGWIWVLRSPEENYLPGPDDIYVSPSQVRRFGMRTGDIIEGEIRAPKESERYFALLKIRYY